MCARNSNEIKFLLENVDTPLIFNQFIDWDLFKWDILKWKDALKDDQLTFRLGKIDFTEEPQWERKTEPIEGNFDYFLKHQESNANKWLYFDYRYLKYWFKNKEDIRNAINWDNFGFPEKGADDSTIWIGNKGAHTPCHIDTYGYNLVAQIYGRKRWILFPPNAKLQKSRIPYEESSIFSKLNFYSPKLEEFVGLTNCKSFILEPGQVLFIPNGWWHYVENLEIAISVNIWIPEANDNEKQINEAIIKSMINLVTKNLDQNDEEAILNPNENFKETSFYTSVEIIDSCLKNVIDKEFMPPKKKIKLTPELSIGEILHKYKNINQIEDLSKAEFEELIQNQAKRFTKINSTNREENKLENLKKIVNAFCDSDVIELIKNKLLNKD